MTVTSPARELRHVSPPSPATRHRRGHRGLSHKRSIVLSATFFTRDARWETTHAARAVAGPWAGIQAPLLPEERTKNADYDHPDFTMARPVGQWAARREALG